MRRILDESQPGVERAGLFVICCLYIIITHSGITQMNNSISKIDCAIQVSDFLYMMAGLCAD